MGRDFGIWGDVFGDLGRASGEFLRVWAGLLGFVQEFWDSYRNFGILWDLGRYLGIFWDVPDSQVEGEQWGGFGAGESLPGHHLQQLPVNLPLLFPHGLRGKITEKIPLKSLEFADPEGFPPKFRDLVGSHEGNTEKNPKNWDLGVENPQNFKFNPTQAPRAASISPVPKKLGFRPVKTQEFSV